MALPSPRKELSKRSVSAEQLSPREIKDFMDKHGISEREMSEIFGVTIQAVWLWLTGERVFSVTNSRLVNMFKKHPNLIREF